MATEQTIADQEAPLAVVEEQTEPDPKAEIAQLKAENVRLEQQYKSAQGRIKEGAVTQRDIERVVQEMRANHVNLRREILSRASLDPEEKAEELTKLESQEQATDFQEASNSATELLNEAVTTFGLPATDSRIQAIAASWSQATTMRQMNVVNRQFTALLRELRSEQKGQEDQKPQQEQDAKRKTQNQKTEDLVLAPRGAAASGRSRQSLVDSYAKGEPMSLADRLEAVKAMDGGLFPKASR